MKKLLKLNFLLALGLLAGAASIAGYFGRLNWLLDLCSQFRLPYVYVFFGLLLLCAFKRRWWQGAVFAGLLVINGVTAFGDFTQPSHAMALSGTPLRVLQM